MIQAESLTITRMVKGACPQQKFDEYTPDLWHELLKDLRFVDARDAVYSLGKRQTWISPAELRAEVQRQRDARIARAFEDIPEADADPTNVAAYLASLRAARRRMGNGEPEPDRPELPARPVDALVEAASVTAGRKFADAVRLRGPS